MRDRENISKDLGMWGRLSDVWLGFQQVEMD